MSAQHRHASNRSLHRQLLTWGWVEDRKVGERRRMRHPLSGETVDVMSPEQHRGNATDVFRDVYRITCDGDADRFWAGPPPLVEAIRRATDAVRAPVVDDLTAPTVPIITRHAARPRFDQPPTQRADDLPLSTERRDTPMPPEPARTPLTPVPSTNTHKGRGSSARLLGQLLVLNGKTRDTATLAQLAGVDRDVAVNALAYLASKGLAERVMRGVYRAADRLTGDVQVRHYATDIARLTQIIADAPFVAPPDTPQSSETAAESPRTPDTAPPQELPPVDELDDGTLYDVLDLLLPGATFTVRHLAAIEEWRRHTLALIRSVTS